MKKLFLAIIALTAFVSTAFPQNAVKPCDVAGYIYDSDPNGLNVRATPGKDGRILTSLKKGTGDISLEIIGTNGSGWVRITEAWHGEDGDVFKGKGWVFASMLATGTRGYPNYNSPSKLYASPSKKSKALIVVPAEAEVMIVDCAGKWAKVRYENTTGWLAPENQCGSPFTTCS